MMVAMIMMMGFNFSDSDSYFRNIPSSVTGVVGVGRGGRAHFTGLAKQAKKEEERRNEIKIKDKKGEEKEKGGEGI